MDNSTFAWFALIGFLSPPLIGALVLIGKKDGEPPILVEGSLNDLNELVNKRIYQ